MIGRIKAKFKGYSYRSVPWLIFQWKTKPVKQISSSEHRSFNQNEKHLLSLQTFFYELSQRTSSNGALLQVMHQVFGFSIERKKSSIETAGNGVFINNGVVPKGSIVAIYPGTVYYPGEPLFFQSLGNSFILQCLDGVLIDGSDSGISQKIFRSCSARDMIGRYKSCDITWLTCNMTNPLAVGQFVNNANNDFPANVTYQELDIPYSFPLNLLQYIPNVNFTFQAPPSTTEPYDLDNTWQVRTVILIALREIEMGEELFSSYFTEVKVNT